MSLIWRHRRYLSNQSLTAASKLPMKHSIQVSPGGTMGQLMQAKAVIVLLWSFDSDIWCDSAASNRPLGITSLSRGDFWEALKIKLSDTTFKCIMLCISLNLFCNLYHGSLGGRFKNTYELVNLGACKILLINKLHIFQCIGKTFCAEFQRFPLKFCTKYHNIYTEIDNFYSVLKI